MRRLVSSGIVVAVLAFSTACTLRPVLVREAGSGDVVTSDVSADATAMDTIVDAVDVARVDAPVSDSPADDADGRVCPDGSCAPVNDDREHAIVIFAMGPADASADASVDASDSGPIDAGSDVARDARADIIDAGPSDTPAADTLMPDTGLVDAGTADAGPVDAGPRDAGPGPADAGVPLPLTFTVRATTVGASHSVDAPCETLRGGADVFYQFVLTDREIVYADSYSALRTFTTILFFTNADGSPVADTPRACDVNSVCAGANGSQIVAVLPAGTYYLVLSGVGTETGAVDLHVKRMPVGAGPIETLAAGVSMRTGRVVTTSSATGYCPGSSGGSNPYYWTTCPSTPAGTLTATACPDMGFGGLFTSLYFRDPDVAAQCMFNVACGGFNVGASVSETILPGPGLNVLYVAGRDLGNSGNYTLNVNRP